MFINSSESECSGDAKVRFSRAAVGTEELDIVFTIWSESWDIPTESHLEVVGVVMSILMVLVIEWGTVPVDVNVDIVNMDVVREDTSKIESEVATLSNWIWVVGGGCCIKGEGSGVIMATSISNNTRISQAVGLDSEGGEHVLDEVLREIVLHWDGHLHVEGSDIGDEKGGGKLVHF